MLSPLSKEQAVGNTVDSASPLLVCFVCTGNTCRSPMAQAVLNHLGRGRGYRACSAGLAANAGHAITPYAAEALVNAGIPSLPDNDYQNHTAQRIDRNLMARCDRIIGISSAHAMALLTQFPEFASKISAMPRDISDPYGCDLDTYETCLAEITDGIRTLFLTEDNRDRS